MNKERGTLPVLKRVREFVVKDGLAVSFVIGAGLDTGALNGGGIIEGVVGGVLTVASVGGVLVRELRKEPTNDQGDSGAVAKR